MMIRFDVLYVVRMIIIFVMCFSWGLKIDLSYEGRKIADKVWWLTIILAWVVFIFFGGMK